MLLSLLLGGFAGVTAAFSKKALKAGVEDPDLIEKHAKIPKSERVLTPAVPGRLEGEAIQQQISCQKTFRDSKASVQQISAMNTLGLSGNRVATSVPVPVLRQHQLMDGGLQLCYMLLSVV